MNPRSRPSKPPGELVVLMGDTIVVIAGWRTAARRGSERRRVGTQCPTHGTPERVGLDNAASDLLHVGEVEEAWPGQLARVEYEVLPSERRRLGARGLRDSLLDQGEFGAMAAH